MQCEVVHYTWNFLGSTSKNGSLITHAVYVWCFRLIHCVWNLVYTAHFLWYWFGDTWICFNLSWHLIVCTLNTLHTQRSALKSNNWYTTCNPQSFRIWIHVFISYTCWSLRMGSWAPLYSRSRNWLEFEQKVIDLHETIDGGLKLACFTTNLFKPTHSFYLNPPKGLRFKGLYGFLCVLHAS